MRELALFAGAGGGILGGMLLGWRTVCAVEIEDYPRRVLLQRQADGILPRFPIWDDVCTFDGKPWRGAIDVISGGFPCQNISAAGKGEGLAGDRSGLWFEMLRVIEEVRPRFVFAENSPNLRTRGLAAILEGLAGLGYDARWCVLGAGDVGAPHIRKRMWVLANARSGRRGQPETREVQQQGRTSAKRSSNATDTHEHDGGSRRPGRSIASCTGKPEPKQSVPDTNEIGRNGWPGAGQEQTGRGQPANTSWWKSEPDVGRVVDGLASFLDKP